MIDPSAVRRTDVDGVPTLWTDLPGPPRAWLALRVGLADERLTDRGVTHLLEHLALFGLGRPGDLVNGRVELTTTVFAVSADSGDPAQLGELLRQLAQQLGNPPAARLVDERRLLTAEAAGRPDSAHAHLLRYRYGARAFGAAVCPESGLSRLGVADLSGWARRFATTGNAVLWLTTPPPAGLRLDLPTGPPQPAPDLAASVLEHLPAYVIGTDDLAMVHTVAPRTPAAAALAHIMQCRLIDEVRTRRAAAYAPQADWSPLTATHGQLIAHADLVPGRQSDAVRYLLALLTDLGGEGTGAPVTDAEVGAYQDDLMTALARPGAEAGMLESAALRLLVGLDPDDGEDGLDPATAVGATTAAEVAAVARDAAEVTLAMVPERIVPRRGAWLPAPHCLFEPVDGAAHHRTGSDTATTDTLVIGAEGISMRTPAGTRTVRVDATEAVLRWLDGRRELIGSDATHVVVEAGHWQDGAAVIDAIDRDWPADVVLERPPRRPGEKPEQPGPAARPTGQDGGTESDPDTTARRGSIVAGVLILLLLAVMLLILAVWEATWVGLVFRPLAFLFGTMAVVVFLRRKAPR